MADNTFQQYQLNTNQESQMTPNAPDGQTGQDFVSIPNLLQTNKTIQVGNSNAQIVLNPDRGFGIGVTQIVNGSNLKPFDLANDGTGNIRRVGAIKLASANDLGISTLNPQPTANKVIYSDNTNDLRLNAPTTGSIVTLDTNGKQRLLVSIIKSSLSDANVNSIFDVAMTTGTYSGGTIDWEVMASDGTEFQTRSGITTWAAVNKGGVYTTDVDEIGGSIADSNASGLTGTWSIVTGTNKITLKFTPNSGLVPTTLTLSCIVKNHNGNVITRV